MAGNIANLRNHISDLFKKHGPMVNTTKTTKKLKIIPKIKSIPKVTTTKGYGIGH